MERQQAPSLSGIAPDHIARYGFAERTIPWSVSVLDLACGCGYGSQILSDKGRKVTGIDIEKEAIEYAKAHYPGPTYEVGKAEEVTGEYDFAVSFETIEHLEKPSLFLERLKAKHLIASVPNEVWYPFKPDQFSTDKYPHRRHYTPEQFEELLASCGYMVEERHCQVTKQVWPVCHGTDGAFLIYVCSR